MKKRAPFQLRSGNKPSPAKLLGVLSGKTKFKDSRLGKSLSKSKSDLKKTEVGKFVTGLTGSIFGSRKNPEFIGNRRSLGGTIKHGARKFAAKHLNKPTKPKSSVDTATIGEVTITAKGPSTKKPMPKGAKYTDAIKIDKSKSFFS